MKNLFKKPSIIISSVVAIAVLISVIFLEVQFYHDHTLLLDRQQMEKCLELGQQAYKADKVQYGGNLNEPQYGFNKKLNSCIYSSGYDSPGGPPADTCLNELALGFGVDDKEYLNANSYQWVKNSATNEEIISLSSFPTSMNGKCVTTDTEHKRDLKFLNESESLFNNTN